MPGTHSHHHRLRALLLWLAAAWLLGFESAGQAPAFAPARSLAPEAWVSPFPATPSTSPISSVSISRVAWFSWRREAVFHHPQTCALSGTVAPATVVKLWKNASQYPDPAHAVTLAVSGTGVFSTSWTVTASNAWKAVPVVVEGRRAGAGDNGTDAVAIARYTIAVPPQTTTFAHNAAGSRAGDDRHGYTWDARGRLTAVARATAYAGVVGESLAATYVYDAHGRRIQKTVGTVVTKWLYDGWQPVMEETKVGAASATRKFYVWGADLSQTQGGAGGIGGLVAVRDATSGKTYFPVTDGRGNIIALLDASESNASTKKVVARWSYDAWGNLASSEGRTDLCPFGWQSKYRDAETGLLYFGYRYYDPSTRRWLSRDPLGEAASFNLYSYGHEDPINNIDPLGGAVVHLADTLVPLVPGLPAFTGEPNYGSVVGLHEPPILAPPVSAVDWDALFALLPGAILPSGPQSFDFATAELELGVESILRTFAANVGKPKYYSTTMFSKAWRTEYESEKWKAEAMEALMSHAGPYLHSAESRDAFAASAAQELSIIDLLAPREVGQNTWAASAMEAFDSLLTASLLVGPEGLALASRASRIAGTAAKSGFGAIGFDQLPTGATSSVLRNVYLREAGSATFKAKLGIQNFLTGGKITPAQIAEQLATNTEFRLVSNIGRSNINLVGGRYVVGGVESSGYFARTVSHHEMMHMAQFIRNPNITTTGFGAIRHEILPSFIGTPEIYGGTTFLIGGGSYLWLRK